MSVLIIEQDRALVADWSYHLSLLGCFSQVLSRPDDGFAAFSGHTPSLVILDLYPHFASALAFADYCAVRAPACPVLVVAARPLPPGASLFTYMPNARGQFTRSVPPSDLAQVAAYHAAAGKL